MKKATLILAALLLSQSAFAGVAFFKYERPSTGFYKVCVYDYLGDEIAITVSSVSLCPLTIQV